VKIVGVDFTSAPKRDKRITVAIGAYDGLLTVGDLVEFSDWPAYEQWLDADDAWLGGFDFPFGLPRRFVDAQRWRGTWAQMVQDCVRGGKERFVEIGMKAFVAASSNQDKHRATDLRAGSHSPLKTKTNPPVGKMFYEGAWRLLSRGIHIPVLNETGSAKIAVEAYPGLLAKRLGFNQYKNDKPANSRKNRDARATILQGLASGAHPLGVTLSLGSALRRRALTDVSGDTLDAILCAVQAAWASGQTRFGMPAEVDCCEGWIVSA